MRSNRSSLFLASANQILQRYEFSVSRLQASTHSLPTAGRRVEDGVTQWCHDTVTPTYASGRYDQPSIAYLERTYKTLLEIYLQRRNLRVLEFIVDGGFGLFGQVVGFVSGHIRIGLELVDDEQLNTTESESNP